MNKAEQIFNKFAKEKEKPNTGIGTGLGAGLGGAAAILPAALGTVVTEGHIPGNAFLGRPRKLRPGRWQLRNAKEVLKNRKAGPWMEGHARHIVYKSRTPFVRNLRATGKMGIGIAAGAVVGGFIGSAIHSGVNLFTNEETEKKAGISSLLAKAITKAGPAVSRYGANVSKDFRLLSRGAKNLKTINTKGILTGKEKAFIKTRAERQLTQGLKGMGKRVLLPGAVGYAVTR